MLIYSVHQRRSLWLANHFPLTCYIVSRSFPESSCSSPGCFDCFSCSCFWPDWGWKTEVFGFSCWKGYFYLKTYVVVFLPGRYYSLNVTLLCPGWVCSMDCS
jgi:hypothetical protein